MKRIGRIFFCHGRSREDFIKDSEEWKNIDMWKWEQSSNRENVINKEEWKCKGTNADYVADKVLRHVSYKQEIEGDNA